MDKQLSRRSFVSGAAASAALGVAAASTAIADEAAAGEIAWDEEADLVVLGIGSAGLGAIKRACVDHGATVIAIEKEPEETAGGATAIFYGFVGGPNTHDHFFNMSDGVFTHEFCDYVNAHFDELPKWLLENSDVEFITAEGDLGTTYMVPDGSVIWKTTYASLKDNENLTLHLESTPNKLIKSAEGEVVGVEATIQGEIKNIKANKGVIVAMGGYGANKEMFQNANAYNLPYEPATGPGIVGDGIKLVCRAGGVREDNNYNSHELFGWAMVKPSEEIGAGMMLNDAISNGAPEMFQRVQVNAAGNRFFAEDQTFFHSHDSLPFIYDWYKDPVTWAFRYTNLPMWTIYDSKVMSQHKLWIQEETSINWTYARVRNLYDWSADNEAEVEKGWVLKADTLEELAAQMVSHHLDGEEFQVDAEQFLATMADYNENICASGEDPFGKNPDFLVPLDTPPFYAVETVPLVGYAYTGVVTDLQHHCLDVDGNIIPGLYAAGDASSMGSQGMPSSGVTQSFLFGGDSAEDALNR